MAFVSKDRSVLPFVAVVNDNPTQLGVLCEVRQAGLEPQAFGGAEVALAAMSNADPPALIITDLYMPGIDGWRFCRLLRSPEYTSFNQVPILVVSATFAGEEPERISADRGVGAFLSMPVNPTDFIAQVKVIVD
jgi:CheY-like chemotaxis protein